MTTLLLIRHGQASFGTDDYDRLSELGFEQAQMIGSGLRDQGRVPGQAWAGTLRRQVETAKTALNGVSPSMEHWSDPSFNEYPIDIVDAFLPQLAERGLVFATADGTWRYDRRLYQQALLGALGLWIAGEAADGVESWVSFEARVKLGLETAVAGRAHDDVVAIFTSGGVIATAIGRVLALPPMQAIALSWRIYNGSISEIHYGRSGFSLAGFNDVGHLRKSGQGRLLTYR